MSDFIKMNTNSLNYNEETNFESYDNIPIDQYVTDMSSNPWEDSYQMDDSSQEVPTLSSREYETELFRQARDIRKDLSLSPADKKLILRQITDLISKLRGSPTQSSPSPDLLSEIEAFQMDLMNLQAQAAEEKEAASEEVYNTLSELRGNVENTEESSYSLSDSQRKKFLSQIDQLNHALDLGEKTENIKSKLETIQNQLNNFTSDEQTQNFLALFPDSHLTIQDLQNAGISDEIKNNHGEMPSDKVIQFITDHDTTLKGFASNEDYAGAMERMSGILSEGFGIEANTPNEEEASKYGIDKKDQLLQIGSKMYELKMNGDTFSISKTDKLDEADQASEGIANQLANLPGVYDLKASDVLARAKELNVDLANLPSSPTPNMINFLISLDKSFAQNLATFIVNKGSVSNGDYAAIRDRMVDFLNVLYPNAVTRKEGGGKATDNIIFRGTDLDIINQDNWKAASSNPALIFDFGGDYSKGPGSDSIFDGMAEGAVAGASAGAILGTIFGPGGTAFGAGVGAAVGGFVGGAVDVIEDIF